MQNEIFMKRKPNKQIQNLIKKLPKEYVDFLAKTGMAKKYPELKEFRSDKLKVRECKKKT